ncbi:uncharacterized protein G2W53_035731 [Senna tora]|uniref:Uncharacterized protein n=1 Tax=Senna tora TaxID=362788 RepID=A0A834SR33_9FABA|nr:uncharacterized protein G2W53_035731 [Senna tora]
MPSKASSQEIIPNVWEGFEDDFNEWIQEINKKKQEKEWEGQKKEDSSIEYEDSVMYIRNVVRKERKVKKLKISYPFDTVVTV